MRVAVLGAGSWGTTFAAVLADAGNDVVLWGRDPAVIAQILGERTSPHISELTVPAAVAATTDRAAAVRGAELVAVAVPAQSARRILAPFAPCSAPTWCCSP